MEIHLKQSFVFLFRNLLSVTNMLEYPSIITGTMDGVKSLVSPIGENYQIRLNKLVFCHVGFSTLVELQNGTEFIWLGENQANDISNIAFMASNGTSYPFEISGTTMKSKAVIPAGIVFIMDFVFILT